MTRKHAIREYSLVIEYYLISGTERAKLFMST